MNEKKQHPFNNRVFLVKKTVLIVDDEEINRDIMSEILKDDFNTLEAKDGQEAIDILLKGEHKVDLVLLDIFMPFDGREVLKLRKNDPNLRRIPFIVCTSDKNIEEECFQLGVNDFVKKPYENPDIIVARIKRMIELYEDRSILKEVERDKLTDLYNVDFFKKYAQQFDSMYPEIDKDMVVLSVNRFIIISELYGKAFGDQILLTITDFLSNFISINKGIVGKGNGSEFMIYCEHHDSYDKFEELLIDELHRLRNDINISIKMGVYPHVNPSLNKDTIIDRTETTANTLTDSYSKDIAVFDESIQARTLHMEELVDAFPQALQEEQFKLYFQPKYNVQADKPYLTSAEVLVRWISPRFGFVSPGEFIPLFEENGLIAELDAYILRKAAEYIKEWKDKLDVYVNLSVNLSRVDIYRPHLLEDIIDYVDSNQVPHSSYYLEITESAFVEDSKEVIPFLSKIKENGFRIEIDDFGSGYSSFGALADLPFDVLKIDMQFIRSMDHNPKVKDIIKMIINLAKMLNAITVAEGVETESQYLFLKESGCDIIQGYYFSKPLPKEEFEQLITKELVK